MIDDLALAHAVRLAVVHWIGGIAIVTTIVIFINSTSDANAAIAWFETFERPLDSRRTFVRAALTSITICMT